MGPSAHPNGDDFACWSFHALAQLGFTLVKEGGRVPKSSPKSPPQWPNFGLPEICGPPDKRRSSVLTRMCAQQAFRSKPLAENTSVMQRKFNTLNSQAKALCR